MGNFKDQRSKYIFASKYIISEISKLKLKYNDLPLYKIQATELLNVSETAQLFTSKINALKSWVTLKEKSLISLNNSWGVPGKIISESDVKLACDKYLQSVNILYEWEVSIVQKIPDTNWSTVFDKLSGSTLSIVESVEKCFKELLIFAENPNSTGQVTFYIQLELPKQIRDLKKDINQAKKFSELSMSRENKELISKLVTTFELFEKAFSIF